MPNDLKTLRINLNKSISRRNQALASLKEEKTQLDLAKREVEIVLTGQSHIQEVAQQVQQQTHQQIGKIVSKCLSAVFEDPYELKIDLERKRGRTEAKFVYLRHGRKVDPKLTSGGVLHVTALALRLASLMITLPPATKFLVLDEPFVALSSANLQKMAMLINLLSNELGIQMLIITHDKELQTGKVIDFDELE